MNALRDWLKFYTEYDDPKIFEYLKNEFYNIQLVVGALWDLNTTKGKVMTVVTTLFAYANISVHCVLFVFTVIETAKWDMGVCLHSLSIVLASIIGLAFLSQYHFHRREVNKIQLETHIYPYKYKGETTVHVNQNVKTLLDVVKYVLGLYGIGTVAVVTLFWCTRNPLEHVQINGVHLNLPLPLYYPFLIETWTSYVTVVCFQYLFAFHVMVIPIATVYAYFTATLNYYVQLNRLIFGVESLEERAESLYANTVTDDQNSHKRNQTRKEEELVACYIYCIKETIYHHRLLRRSWTDFERVNGMATMCVITVMSIFMAICTNTILGDTSLEQKSLAVYMLTNGFSGVFLVCLTGQMFFDKEEEFQFAVYSLPWYNYNKRIVVILNFLLLAVHKPLKLKAMSIVSCNLHTICLMLKNAYAYHNALRLLH